MTLKTQIITDLTTIFNADEFAETVSYGGVNVVAVLDPEETQVMPGNRIAKRATLFVKASDVASPAYRDVVVIGGVTWYVIEVPGASEGGVWQLVIQQDERPVI